MKTNRIASAATSLLLLLSLTAARSGARTSSAIDACSLLTVADASKALEQTSQPGKRMMPSSPDGCIWSADPAASDSSRKIALNTHTARAFGFGKSPAITTIKVEPVSGVGDEAYFQIYPAPQSPFIWVRKGSNAISIRIMGTKTNQFSLAQNKDKLLTLAKAAVGRL